MLCSITEVMDPSTYYERVPLADQDFDRIDLERLSVLAISFNNRHGMRVDGEVVSRIAGNVHEAESITREMLSVTTEFERIKCTYRFPCWTFTTASSASV